jgi:hypothetical protein
MKILQDFAGFVSAVLLKNPSEFANNCRRGLQWSHTCTGVL